jgi:hypothetical protein
MRVNGGHSFCIDAATRDRERPKAVEWYPTVQYTYRDFWREFRQRMRDGLEMMVEG